jgi:hypothetical protein
LELSYFVWGEGEEEREGGWGREERLAGYKLARNLLEFYKR